MLEMDLGSGECGGYAIVALRGELDLVDATAVAAALRAVAAREPRIIVDLAGLEFIDVSGSPGQAVVPIRRQSTRMR
jgi:anti-anti-sigma factor